MNDSVQLAADGEGPLLQRDYWAVICGCRVDPEGVMDVVRKQFEHLAPRDLVRFDHSGEAALLNEGDTLEVRIRMAPKTAVRVVNVNRASITIATLQGHPEAGKITFGAYSNQRGDVIFHIRSRVRSRSSMHLAGFLTAGDPMQTNTWSDFIDRLAHAVGDGVIGEIHADKREVADEREDAEATTPTFIAKLQ